MVQNRSLECQSGPITWTRDVTGLLWAGAITAGLLAWFALYEFGGTVVVVVLALLALAGIVALCDLLSTGRVGGKDAR